MTINIIIAQYEDENFLKVTSSSFVDKPDPDHTRIPLIIVKSIYDKYCMNAIKPHKFTKRGEISPIIHPLVP